MAAAQTTLKKPAIEASTLSRKFDFDLDRFAFPNELVWEYRFDSNSKKTSFTPRLPKPTYAHRCFVLARTTRQFFYHAIFDAAQPKVDEEKYRRLIQKVVSRNPRNSCPSDERIVIPGYSNLYHFSQNREALLKVTCGGAWQSYLLRSHWRMIFPVSRNHQEKTAAQLIENLRGTILPVVHLVTFPALTINHGVIIFDGIKTKAGWDFSVYDPNVPQSPTTLSFDSATKTFSLPANLYWAGGNLNVIEIYRNWFL